MLISDWSSDVCSSDLAVWNDDHILTSTAERDALRRLQALGLYDAFRLHHDAGGIFSRWDYRQAAFRRDLGLRIDLTLVSDALREQAVEAGIDREPRTWERPSDHTPAGEIGRAAGRERVCPYVEISWIAEALKKKINTHNK